MVKLAPNSKDALAKLKACESEIRKRAFEVCGCQLAARRRLTPLPGRDSIRAQSPCRRNFGHQQHQYLTDFVVVGHSSNVCPAVEASYDGPRLEGEITEEFVLALMTHFKNQKQLHRKYALDMLLRLRALLKDSPSLHHVRTRQHPPSPALQPHQSCDPPVTSVLLASRPTSPVKPPVTSVLLASCRPVCSSLQLTAPDALLHCP